MIPFPQGPLHADQDDQEDQPPETVKQHIIESIICSCNIFLYLFQLTEYDYGFGGVGWCVWFVRLKQSMRKVLSRGGIISAFKYQVA